MRWSSTRRGRVAALLGIVRHVVIDIDLRAFGGSALTSDTAVPKDTPLEAIGAGIPPTYVPARNTVFLALALAWAETLDARDIFLGANALDYSGYPDCRPEYVEAFQRMANLATRAGVEGGGRITIHTPLIALSKREISPRAWPSDSTTASPRPAMIPLPTEPPAAAVRRASRLKGFREAGGGGPGRKKRGTGRGGGERRGREGGRGEKGKGEQGTGNRKRERSG